MIIEHRGIYPDRFDTPFGIGTLIFAKDCHHHCRGCFHQEKHTLPILREDINDIFSKVAENTFTNGIILAGFEWTEQYDQLIAMIERARELGLEVILYTHYTIQEISTDYSDLLKYKSMYIKCGEYDDTCLDPTYTSYGVPLASRNQKIYKVGYDTWREN